MPATIPFTTSRRSKQGGIARGGRTWAGKRTGRHLSRWTGAALHATGSEGRQPCLDRAGETHQALAAHALAAAALTGREHDQIGLKAEPGSELPRLNGAIVLGRFETHRVGRRAEEDAAGHGHRVR